MSDHGFNTAQISFIKQLITNRNKEVRHEVSDHLDNVLPVKKIKGDGASGDVATVTPEGTVEWAAPTGGGGGVTDHGALTGLADDDHAQYHNDTRGDARYQLLDADLTTIAALDSGTSAGVMATEAAGWVKRTYAQVKTSLGLVKADVGLGNVDNTTDAGKPVSTAQQTALDLKANLASPTFTGAPSLPTAATAVTQAENDASTKISTTAYVDRATGNASSARPACKLYGPTPTSCGDNTNTPITAWASESFDTDNMHSAVTNTGRITINTPGTYIVHAKAYFSSDTAANTSGYTTILVNGTTAHYLSTMPVRTVDSGLDNIFDQTVVLQLAAGDYLEMHVYQNNAVNTSETLQSGATQTTFSAVWIGGTGAAWGNAGVRATQTTAQSCTNGANTLISFDGTDTFDIDASHDPSTNPSRLTCKTAGTFLVKGTAAINDLTTTGARYIALYKNGTVIDSSITSGNPNTSTYCHMTLTELVQLNVGDYVELGLVHSAGSSKNTSPTHCSFGMVRVGYQTNPADLPGTYVASMYAANSGAPTHTSSGGWQKVGSGGGTLTWTSEIDKRPSGVSAQVDTATNKRIDIRKTGLYRVGYSVGFSALADGKTFSPAVYKNGALIIEHNQRVGSAGTPISNGSRIVSLTSGDYLELYAWQDDSASEAYYVANSSDTFLQAEYLGPAT